jgi:hypothetical protein
MLSDIYHTTQYVAYAGPIANTFFSNWFWLLTWHEELSENVKLPGGSFLVEFDTDVG